MSQYTLKIIENSKKFGEVIKLVFEGKYQEYETRVKALANDSTIIDELYKKDFSIALTLASVISFIALFYLVYFVIELIRITKKYYTYYTVSNKNNNPRNSILGATWSYFIPFLNLFRPFYNLSEGLEGLNKNKLHPKVLLPMYMIFCGIFLFNAMNLIQLYVPNWFYFIREVSYTLYLFLFMYLIKNVFIEIFENQSSHLAELNQIQNP
ncbi:MAG: hypothetical protein ACRCXZ_08575 [Patescibacteria group bacterium]